MKPIAKIFTVGESKPLFCEMDELDDEKNRWKEAARWVKFEEDVFEGGRWSKPHVATLSLHSLLELRTLFSTDAQVLFDLEAENFKSIVHLLLDSVIESGYLDEDKRDLVRNTLLLEHVHPYEKKLFKTHLFERKSSSAKEPDEYLSPTDLSFSISSLDKSNQRKDILALSYSNASLASKSDQRMNQSFMKKIPPGAEACNVLVGEVDFLEKKLSILIRLEKSVLLSDLTEVPVPTRFIFIILGPKGNIKKYHQIGRSISTLMSDEIFNDFAYNAKNRDELLFGLDEFLDQLTVLPPGEWNTKIRIEPPKKTPLKEERLEKLTADSSKIHEVDKFKPHDLEGLEFTGRFCGGLIDDIKRKAPWYLSDFRDGLNFQCVSSILFMYFACLSPIITFGGLLGVATDQNMASIESLLSGLICGVLYALFAGQPLTLLGSTGPVLVFESILNTWSKENNVDYMGFRAYVGLWTAFILLVIVVTDCSALVKYITKFTEEAFASLIALIFIIESIDKLLQINQFKRYSSDQFNYKQQYFSNDTNCYRCINSTVPDITIYLNEKQCIEKGYKFTKECKYTPDVFFFSVLLYLFTFGLAMTIRFFKKSKFFPTNIRSIISDFGVPITIFTAVLIDYIFGFDTPKLIVPLKFETTLKNRGWFINPIERNSDKLWLCPLAIVPAILATILIFMDQHISCVIINRKENKLEKGGGYHLDLLIVTITIAVNSLLGIPWFVAATVLSINHVISLKKESEAAAPGEKPLFLGVIEQRITNVVVFIMIGLSVFLSEFLSKIPMPVLYGIFFYMGISSLNGIQFIKRILLIFMPEKHQPNYKYLRHVKTYKVHLFTFIQIASIVLLFIIKSNKRISIFFPLMVLALVGIRKMLDFIFTQRELFYLDDIMPSIIKNKNQVDKEETSNFSSKFDSTNKLKESQVWRNEVLNEVLNSNINLDKRNNSEHKIIIPKIVVNQF